MDKNAEGTYVETATGAGGTLNPDGSSRTEGDGMPLIGNVGIHNHPVGVKQVGEKYLSNDVNEETPNDGVLKKGYNIWITVGKDGRVDADRYKAEGEYRDDIIKIADNNQKKTFRMTSTTATNILSGNRGKLGKKYEKARSQQGK